MATQANELAVIGPQDGQVQQGSAQANMFSFGDAESVLDRRELWDYCEMWQNGSWYEPPMPMAKLAQTFNMAPTHRSAIGYKVAQLVRQFIPSRWLSRHEFEKWALDFMQMANAYMEGVPNMAGGLAKCQHSPAKHTRVGVSPGTFFFLKNGYGLGKEHEFKAGSIFHLFQPDVSQEVYGVPEWLAALQSGLLNENATLFRRRYYLNGAHAGFVFYLSEPLADTETAQAVEDRLKSAKGVGNFKNMFVHIPNGKKDGVQILPISDVMAKDEFSNIKNISRDDLLTAHRVPPQLIGIIPQNNGGFGPIGDTADVYFELEIVPIIERMMEMNDFFGVKVIDFKPWVKLGKTATEPATGTGGRR